MNLFFSDVYQSDNYIGFLAKFTCTPSGFIHFARDSFLNKGMYNLVYSFVIVMSTKLFSPTSHICRLGAYHDGEAEARNCASNSGYIMSYSREDAYKFSRFSLCSVNSFQNFLRWVLSVS